MEFINCTGDFCASTMDSTNSLNISRGCVAPQTISNSTRPYNPRSVEHIRFITLVFYLITFLFGLFGNSLVLYIIARFKKVRQRSVANYYIFNLALADLLFILTLPIYCYSTYSRTWIFGSVVCKIANVIYECNRFASVFTLMALSFDRYLATYPLMGKFRTVKVGKIVCVCIWLAGLSICIPNWIFSKVTTKDKNSYCELSWPNHPDLLYKHIWTYFQLVIGLLIPLPVIACSNILLLRRLKGLAKPGCRRPTANTTKTTNSSSSSRCSTSMTRTVLAIVVLFMFCQIPHYVKKVITMHVLLGRVLHCRTPSPGATYAFVHFNLIAVILVFISSCANPVLYGIFNRNYRDLYTQVLCCSSSCCSKRSRTSIAMTSRSTRVPVTTPDVKHHLVAPEAAGHNSTDGHSAYSAQL